MEQQQVLFAALLILVAGTITIALFGGSGQERASDGGGDTLNESGDVRVTSDGTRYTVHPDKLMLGCSGKDCIPSIDDPSFVSADAGDQWLADDDLVLGVAQDGVVKAYPFRILNVHEIVNDAIGGQPIAATYCPLCRSGLVYSRVVDGQVLAFGVSGRLLNANLVMYDRETETYWSQIQGEAIVGPLAGAELELLPSQITEWAKWQQAHPDTQVLSRDTGIYPTSTYSGNPYSGYQSSERVGFGVDHVDQRLPSKDIVYGIIAGGTATAYQERTIEAADVINDRVGDVPVVVVEDQDTGGINAFIRRSDNTTLTFTLEDGALVDQNGRRWGFDGIAKGGPHAGARLERIPTHGFHWFAWAAFHPDTRLYNRTG